MREIIKNLLREAVGVPQNIERAGKSLFDAILKKIEGQNFPVSQDNFNFKLKNTGGKYDISDFKPTTLNVTFDFVVYDNPEFEGIVFPGMSTNCESTWDSEFFIDKQTRQVNVTIVTASPKSATEISGKEIADKLRENRAFFESSLVHELKHAYDSYKKNKIPISTKLKYLEYSNLRFGLQPIDEFMYYMYYTHITETLVRASEMYTYLLGKGTTKKSFYKDFMETLDKNRINIMKNYSYEELRNKLASDEKELDEFLAGIKGYPYPTDTLNQKVDAVLDISHYMLKSKLHEKLQSLLAPTLIRKMLGFISKQEAESINRTIKGTLVQDNWEGFYKKQIKKINRFANNLIKKLSKVYSILPENQVITTEIFDPSSFEMDQLYRKTKKHNTIYNK
jgi:hypothetical protein